MDRRGFLTLSSLALSGLIAIDAVETAEAKEPKGLLKTLPGHKHQFAWTIDDGASATAISRYVDFAKRTDARLTFFVTSAYPAWRKNAHKLQPLIETGQIQVANHTFTHKWLTRVSNARVKSELMNCHHFLQDTFGVDARPFYRPPYGAIDNRVIRIARDLGYTSPTLWLGELARPGDRSVRHATAQANKWLRGGNIVIDHANDTTTTKIFDHIEHLMRARKLQTVTLNDIWQTSAQKAPELKPLPLDVWFNPTPTHLLTP